MPSQPSPREVIDTNIFVPGVVGAISNPPRERLAETAAHAHVVANGRLGDGPTFMRGRSWWLMQRLSDLDGRGSCD
jgi:hypothetical protein